LDRRRLVELLRPSSANLRRFVAAVGVLVIACVWASFGYDVWENRRTAIQGSSRELKNLAQVLSEQAARSLQAIDLILRDTASWYESPDGRKASAADVEAYLRTRAAGVPQLRSLNILDEQGQLAYWSRNTSNPDRSLAVGEAFLALRNDAGDRLYVSAPVRSATDSRMGFDLGRPLIRGGTFEGIVLARVETAYYEEFYKAVALGEDSTIALLRDDGTLLARHPDDEMRIGARVPSILTGFPADAHSPVVTRAPSALDGRDRYRALARVPGLPVVVAVARDTDSVLHSWREGAVGGIFSAVALSAIIGLLTLALVRELRRRDSSMAALRQSEERYQFMTRGSNEGYWDWNLVDDTIQVSPRLRELYGMPPDKPFATLADWRAEGRMHPDDVARFDAAVKEHLSGGSPRVDAEYRVRNDLGERWLHLRGLAFRDEHGKPYRMSGSVSDITDRKRAEEERNRLEAQLRRSQKLEAMGTLAGGIAHDFNNILGAILGYGDMAQRAAAGNNRLGRYLDNVMNAAARARTLVERILAFSTSGMSRRVPFHIQATVEETLDLLRASIPARIRLERHLEAGNAAVVGDATGVHQIVMNLCTNAMQAIEGNGTVTVSLRRQRVDQARRVQSGQLAPGEYVTLCVADTGTGIDPAIQDLVFDPFFTTKPVGEGTGLGLSLVHGMVTEMGGGIDMHSVPGAGTTFNVYLPYGGDLSRTPDASTEVLPRGNGETVLLLDDEPMLVSLNEELLAGLGYEPIGFTSSVEALRAFREHPDRFDAIFTDETMPDMTGTEFARAVKQLRPEIPVVLMSGYSGTALSRRAQEAGIPDVLRKPLRLEDVARTLASVLATSST